MPRSSRSSQGNDASPAHSWLVEQVYEPKRERTFELVKRSVDVLLEQKERISLASIAATSKQLDPAGQGVSESAILGNELARAYYESGEWRATPVNLLTVGTDRYLVAPRGETQWARNLRVAGDDGIVPDAWGAGDVAAVPDLTGGGIDGFTVPNAQHAFRPG